MNSTPRRGSFLVEDERVRLAVERRGQCEQVAGDSHQERSAATPICSKHPGFRQEASKGSPRLRFESQWLLSPALGGSVVVVNWICRDLSLGIRDRGSTSRSSGKAAAFSFCAARLWPRRYFSSNAPLVLLGFAGTPHTIAAVDSGAPRALKSPATAGATVDNPL